MPRTKPKAQAQPSVQNYPGSPIGSKVQAMASNGLEAAAEQETKAADTKAKMKRVAQKPKAGGNSGQPNKKPKLIRDSFTFPEADYALIAQLKQRALNAKREVKKSEVLRAALNTLASLPEADFVAALERVERLVPGRPGK